MFFLDFQPMTVSEGPVCIHPVPVYTSLHLRSPFGAEEKLKIIHIFVGTYLDYAELE